MRMAKQVRIPMTAIPAIGALVASVGLTSGPAARGDLFAYLAKEEPKFAWRQLHNDTTAEGRVIAFTFTSQTWRGIDWNHQLRVYEPAEVKYPKLVLLFITGGSSTSEVKPGDHAQGFALARACGARVAVLPQVPNQPLLDGKYEDDLIGETFVNFIETQESDWPLLLPMVKSAIKAMDAVEAWAGERGEAIEGFVVTGASKRGWTTWLTAAADPRVKAIAPMVIPTLNMKAQSKHQLESWGFYSEQIEDYTRRGLTEKFDDPVGSKLWKMVDPWSYLDRIKVPVLQINGTNDRYWTLDSMNLYWDDIRAPKCALYLPNAGHDLNPHRQTAMTAIGALFRHVATGRPMPEITASRAPGADGEPTMIVTTQPAAKWAQFWSASAVTRDFRESIWQEHPAVAGNPETLTYRFFGGVPEGENGAVFATLGFEIDGIEYHLTTPILMVPARPKPD